MKSILALFLVLLPILSYAQQETPMSYADRSKDVFTRLNIDNMDVVDEFYDQKIEFHDPIGSISGRDNMRAYYKKMYDGLKSIKFDYYEAITMDKTVVLVWKMTYAVDKLNSGEPIAVEGNSVIKFGGPEDKAIYHRDYFDVGAMVYEFVPVLGWGVRKIKEKLGEH